MSTSAERAKNEMRGFDSLPAAMRAALNDEPTVNVTKARRLIKNMGEQRAAEYVASLPASRLQMQRSFTQAVVVRK